MRAVLTGVMLLCLALPALAQAPESPQFAAAKARFEALDLETRRAIQRDLVWAGGFNGAASGEFGPATFAALQRFEAAAGLKKDGMIDPAKRAALAKAAQAPRAAVGFAVQTDKASGMKIGVPLKVLPKGSTNPGGLSRWQDSADKVTLDLHVGKPGDTLPQLFDKGTDARVAGRRITYKLLKPEFFVIAGETAGGRFYRRTEMGSGGKLHGFSIGYDKSLARDIDPLVAGIASTFEGFPAARPASAAAPQGSPASAAVPVVAARPLAPRLTGVIIGGGQVLTAQAGLPSCRRPALGGVLLSPGKSDTATGLALLTGAPATARALSLAAEDAKDGLLMQREAGGALVAAPARMEGGLVAAPLQHGGAGAPVMDASGALLGLVVAEPAMKYAVAGIVPVQHYRLANRNQISAFAGVSAAGTKGQPLASSALAQLVRDAVVAINCEP